MPVPAREYLDPSKKLADAAADALAARARRTPEGAASLAHVLAIVPTAQSARNLRLALARRFPATGVVPPAISMPSALLEGEGRVANGAEELAAMARALEEAEPETLSRIFPAAPGNRNARWAVSSAAQLLAVESILGEGALSICDVECEADRERWRSLAEIEKRFFAILENDGVSPRVLARKAAAAAGCRIAGIEEIVLPAFVDTQGALVKYLENSAQKITLLVHARESEADAFDEWGRPVREIAESFPPSMIAVSPDPVSEADETARFFAEVDPQDALPALVVCDGAMMPELEGAFRNRFPPDVLEFRNPSRQSFRRSPLGRLLETLIDLSRTGSYDAFSTFIRTGDAARWAADALDATPAEIARYVSVLDKVQNMRMPATLEETADAAEELSRETPSAEERDAAAGLARLSRAVLAKRGDPFAFLPEIFATLTLDENDPSHRELAAAAACVRDARAECESPLVPDRLKAAVLSRRLAAAGYMLEPLSRNVLAAAGWLETQYLAEDEIVFCGFNETCVPESIVGHPFVPDSLRAALGLATNASRGRRDAFILAEAIRCRAKNAVTLRMHQIAGDGNVMKPSRLVFPCVPDAELGPLAARLYSISAASGAGAPAKAVPRAWLMKLPVPPKEKRWRARISATMLDSYMRDPFKFLLYELFGEKTDDRKRELDAREFGTLCHDALDDFAKSPLKDSEDADEIAAFLREAVRRRLSRFPDPLPAVVELQGEAACERLSHFAARQAERRRAGWRIAFAEEKMECTIGAAPTRIRGRIDRIDTNENDDIEIIDYKTWDDTEKKRDSVQLAIYRAMLEASGRFDPAKARSCRALYCVLAKNAADAGFDTREDRTAGEAEQGASEERIVSLLDGLARGIYWPPGKRQSREKDDLDALFPDGPSAGLDPAWIEDQERRIKERDEERKAAGNG